jgi:hypothetical protein
MAEAKTKEVVKCKVISKNPRLSKIKGDKRIISVRYNHNKFNIPEGVETELPAGLINMLKIHITKKIVPTGNGSVKGKSFKSEVYNSFEVIEL